jgi:ElaB/YqjD/DUF883 family membrane-anchored ribosome-binding protein
MAIKEKVKRVKTDWPGSSDAYEETHPSFGQLSISRQQVVGGRAELYGSSIKHSNIISVRIHESRRMIDGEHTWYFDKAPIIEVHMSPSQFAEAITTLNVGGGVPCTIYHKEKGDIIEPAPLPSKEEQHEENFRQRMLKYASRLDDYEKNVNTILESQKPVSKKEREMIKNEISHLLQEIRSNIPYFEEQFRKQMEKTITEAKAEMDAFVTHAIQSTGLQVLQGESKKLIEIQEEKNENGETV